MLFSRCLVAALTLGLALSAWSQTATEDAAAPAALPRPADATDQPDDTGAVAQQVLVTGKRLGPGLWKVSKGDHVLWIFGAYSPLPTKMEWRSRDVEHIVATSQEYLMPPGASAGVGFFKSIAMLPFMFGVKNNPDGKELKDVLPPDVYARWLPHKKKYFGDDDSIERQRPVFVAQELYRRALSQAGLANGREVRELVENIVKTNKIKMTRTLVSAEIKEPTKALREFKKSSLDDTACFATTLTQLETDIDAMRVRANAWATGDVKVIQNLDYAERERSCNEAFLSSSVAKSQPELQSMRERSVQAWLDRAEKSLAANSSTFALLQLKDMFGPSGLLAALQAKGYTVEPPK